MYMIYKGCIKDVGVDGNTNESHAGCSDCNYTLQIQNPLYSLFSCCKCIRIFRVSLFAFQILTPLSTPNTVFFKKRDLLTPNF